MAGRKRKTPPQRVVRRAAGPRPGLPPEIDALARGEIDRLSAPRRGPRLRDPRATALIPGVANRDARELCDRRIERLRSLRASGHEEDLAVELGEAVLLAIWRGRSLTSLDALAEELVGIDAPEARALADRGKQSLGVESISDEAVAVWLRAEQALAHAGLEGRVVVTPGPERLRLELPVDSAARALVAIGRHVSALARDQEEHR